MLMLERDAGEIEIPDGGVGDDLNVASVSPAGPTFDVLQFAMPVWGEPPIVCELPLSPREASQYPCDIPRLCSTVPERLACLQCFLC
jgi:hypothetical protein